MSAVFSTVKGGVFIFNLICLMLGVATIVVCSLDLQNAQPNTDEHTYFIIATILASFLCLTSFFGFYGVVCELVGVNAVYSFFLAVLITIQYTQMRDFEPQGFYKAAVQRLDIAWRQVQTQPYAMENLELHYHCCGLYNATDYSIKGLGVPPSCYFFQSASQPEHLSKIGCMEALRLTYQRNAHREKYFNWGLFIAECVACLYSIILSLFLVRQNRRHRLSWEPIGGYVEPHINNCGSRTNLLSH